MSPVQEPGWLEGLRRRAEKDVVRIGMPDRSHEDWKHLAVRDLLPVTTALPSHELAALATESILPEAWAALVFVGGIFRADLSRLPEPTRDWNVESLSRAIDIRGADVVSRLGYADPTNNALMALNMEHWSDGLFLRVSEGCELPGPVQVLDVASGTSWLRHLVILGAGSTATLLETHVAPDHLSTASHTVTEAMITTGATLRHVRLQRSGATARSWNALTTKLDAGARLEARHFALGAGKARAEIHANLDGTGSHVGIDGLAATAHDHLSDCVTTVHHNVPDCTSNQVWKALVQDKAVSSFVGNLLVAKGADGTEARQSNRSILLSREATIHSRPQLEIWADDVKCSHGSAIGKLDEKALFFLRSRGLSPADAKKILVRAFADEVVAPLPWESVRSEIETLLESRI